MKIKITIITAFPISTPHPRVETEKKVLTDAGFEVKVLSFTDRPTGWQRLINYSSVNYFKKHLYNQVLKSINDEDIIILYDYPLLPLVPQLKKRNVKVIYETIDNMVHLNYHVLIKKWPTSRFIGKRILNHYIKLEKRLASEANAVIVNSKALTAYFKPVQTNLIYYSSPFENNTPDLVSPSSSALIYLGLFSYDKGAEETLGLQAEMDLPLFLFGDIKNDELSRRVRSNQRIIWKPRQSPGILKDQLKEIQSRYRLLGCSIIHPIHHSYATQEANKDQDYLALGIPILGNRRYPTYEKIKAGCGMLFEETERIKELAGSENLYRKYSQTCRVYYHEHYAYDKFNKELLKVVDQLLGQTT